VEPKVIQQGATAGGDIVGRDKIETHVHAGTPRKLNVVEELLQKLQAEIEHNAEVRHTVDALARFHVQHSPDGIIGLEAKLKVAGRSGEYLEALEQKEYFAKLLERWSLYASAQEIFAYLLAQAEFEFKKFILPQIEVVSEIELNQLIKERIVIPTIEQCGANIFTFNHATVMGMLYWLAEQCYVRWHK
jgi:hypothetical protein